MPDLRTFLSATRRTHPGTRCLAATAATVGLALTFAACGGSSTTGSANHDGHSTSPSATAALGTGTEQHDAADVTFAQSMIPHHQQAVEMAEMGATKAASPAVKQLAAQIQAAQDPEITSMTGWLTAWGQPTAMPSMTMSSDPTNPTDQMLGSHHKGAMPGMMSDADMTGLGALSGPAFDGEFLTMMSAHHTGASEMARSELAQGQYAPAKKLATSIIADQTAEITTMRTLLTQI